MGTDGALVAPAVFKTVCVRLAADGWVRFPDVPAIYRLASLVGRIPRADVTRSVSA
jgi:hypothetical protein